MFENRRWLIISSSLTGSIDFNQVLESDSGSLRLSIDGSKTFIKYDINEITSSYEQYYDDPENPGTYFTASYEAGIYGRPSIYNEGDVEYTHEEILNVLTGSEWTIPFNETGSAE